MKKRKIKNFLIRTSEKLRVLEEKRNKEIIKVYKGFRNVKKSPKIDEIILEYLKNEVLPLLRRFKNINEIDSKDRIKIDFLKRYSKFLEVKTVLAQETEGIIKDIMKNISKINKNKITNKTELLVEKNEIGKENKELYIKLFEIRKKILKKYLNFPLTILNWSTFKNSELSNYPQIYKFDKLISNVIRELKILFKELQFNKDISNLSIKILEQLSDCNSKPKKIKSKKLLSLFLSEINKKEIARYIELIEPKGDFPFEGLCVGSYFNEATIFYKYKNDFQSLRYFFHEVGHAIYTICPSHKDYLLVKAEPEFFDEGIATCFEEGVFFIDFILKFIENFTRNEIKKMVKYERVNQLKEMILMTILVQFEEKIYLSEKNTEPEKVFNSLCNKYGIRNDFPFIWASFLSFTKDVYYIFDYLIAEIIRYKFIKYYYNRSRKISIKGFFDELFKNLIQPLKGEFWWNKLTKILKW